MTLSAARLGPTSALHRGDSAYDPDGQVHLAGFAGSMAAYGAAVAALAAAARAGGQEVPERYAVGDLVLGGVATHKLTRLLSRSSVASPLRAPFTTFEAAAGSGEHVEEPRGHGVRHTVGELLTCPFCLGVWVATGYVAGLTLAPRSTRAVAAVLSVTAASDALQHAYARLRGD
jgi:hypothetical protein